MRNLIGPIFLLAITVSFYVAAVAIPSSCGSSVNCTDPKNAQDATCVTENILVECAGSDTAGVIAQYAPTIEDIISKGVQVDGTINWSLVGTDLIAAVAKYGWCVVSAVFERYISPPAPAGSGSGAAAPPALASGKARPTPRAALDTFNKLRAQVWPQAKFHTAAGVL